LTAAVSSAVPGNTLTALTQVTRKRRVTLFIPGSTPR
jgi:hypothetical protein